MRVLLQAMQGLGKPGRNFMKFIEWNIYENPDYSPMPRDADYLTGELDILIQHLQEYADALKNRDAQKLHDLLKDGREKKDSAGGI